MAKNNLKSDISENISKLSKLYALNPSKKLLNVMQDMFDALQKAQAAEWADGVQEYNDAKQGLDAARKVAEKAIDDLKKTADAIDKASKAIKLVLTAVAILA